MFNKPTSEQNNSPQNNPLSPPDNKMNFDQQKDFQMENFPVHNMKTDLKNIDKPDYFTNTSVDTPLKTTPAKTEAKEPPKSQNTGPFLSQAGDKNPKETQPKEPQKEHPGIGRAIIIAVVLFIVIIAGGGGYYFWMTRMATEPSQAPIELMPEPPVIPEPPIAPMPTFSKNSPNYLSIDIENSDTQTVQTTLNDYADKINETDEIAVFEFLITDSNNNPVSFQDFSQKFGLTLSQNILSNLGSNFSFFIYNYGDKTRFGLSVDSLDNSQLKNFILTEEKNLIQGLEPLFNNLAYTASDILFVDTTYQEAAIRFFNISSPEELSVDYSIHNNQLIIATTKTAMFSIIDYKETPLLIE